MADQVVDNAGEGGEKQVVDNAGEGGEKQVVDENKDDGAVDKDAAKTIHRNLRSVINVVRDVHPDHEPSLPTVKEGIKLFCEDSDNDKTELEASFDKPQSSDQGGGRRRTKRKGRKGSKKSKKGAKKSKKGAKKSQKGGRSSKNRRKHSRRRKH
jgi:hypothetical protein